MKYTVHLNAHACKSYTVEANSPAEAYKIVNDEYASLSDVEGSDWNHEEPGEISDENGETININDLPEEAK